MSTMPAIRVDGLGKRYRLEGSPPSGSATDRFESGARGRLSRFRRWSSRGPGFWALRDVSFELEPGEILGVIGANGAGKSTLLKILSRITEPTTGRAEVYGRLSSLLEVGTGFHPELSGRDNVYLNGVILGMRRSEIDSRFDEIVEFSGVERFIDTPVKFYSSGMQVRLAFAVAAHLDPDILVIDEVLAVGDLDFQRRCLGRMDEVAHSGRTIVFVSHNLAAVASLCTRGLLLEQGRVTARGEVAEVLERYVASTDRAAIVSLSERCDRHGTGRLRFTSVGLVGPEGALRTGDDTVVELEYEASHRLGRVLVSLAVYGPMGEPVFLCSTEVAGTPPGPTPEHGTFACHIPSLPLLPGRYSLNIYAEVDGVVADWVEHAHVFDVVEGDFFGSGKLPPTSHGRLLVPHSWAVREAFAIPSGGLNSG